MIVKQADFTIEAVRYATMMVAVGPIIFVYPFLQRYFIKGMLIGAIKG
jgi:putative aldouronate transport system permease protein